MAKLYCINVLLLIIVLRLYKMMPLFYKIIVVVLDPCPKLLSCVLLCVTPWTGAHQAPLSVRFRRQEYWSGLLFPPPGGLPDPGVKPESLVSPALLVGSLLLVPSGKPVYGCQSTIQKLTIRWFRKSAGDRERMRSLRGGIRQFWNLNEEEQELFVLICRLYFVWNFFQNKI